MKYTTDEIRRRQERAFNRHNTETCDEPNGGHQWCEMCEMLDMMKYAAARIEQLETREQEAREALRALRALSENAQHEMWSDGGISGHDPDRCKVCQARDRAEKWLEGRKCQ